MGPDVTPRGFADLTDVTLADENTNSIQTDNANRAILGNMTMQVMQVIQAGGQLWIQCKWHHQMTKFLTNANSAKITADASCAIWWPNLQLMQVAPSGGQIYKRCKWYHLVAKFTTNANSTIWF